MGRAVTVDELPDARARLTKRLWVHHKLGPVVAVYCVNCGADGGFVTEDTPAILYLCDDCAQRHGRLPLPEIPDPRV